MKRKMLFLMSPTTRRDNLGDELIFLHLARALEAHGTVLVKGSESHVDGISTLGSEWRSRTIRLLARLRGQAIVNVHTPGAVLWVPEKRVRPPAGRSWIPDWVKAWVDEQDIALGRSVIPGTDQSWADKFAWLGVRDEASLQALRDHGIRNVVYLPDLAFLSPIESPSGADVERSGIALSFRKMAPDIRNSEQYTGALQHAVGELVGASRLVQRNQALFFHQVHEDASFNHDLAIATGAGEHPTRLTLDSYLDFYKRFSMVVSNRLHCLLLGAQAGAVPVALTSQRHTKVVSLFETVGWHKLIIDIDDPDGPPTRLDEIRESLDRLQPMVQSEFNRQRQLGFDVLEQGFRSFKRQGRS